MKRIKTTAQWFPGRPKLVAPEYLLKGIPVWLKSVEISRMGNTNPVVMIHLVHQSGDSVGGSNLEYYYQVLDQLFPRKATYPHLPFKNGTVEFEVVLQSGVTFTNLALDLIWKIKDSVSSSSECIDWVAEGRFFQETFFVKRNELPVSHFELEWGKFLATKSAKS